MIDDIDAPEATPYKIEVISGVNKGAVYDGILGNNVPVFLQGQGLFDSSDNVKFSTGDNFSLTSTACIGSINGTFANGGNGEFVNMTGLTILDCISPPVVNNLYHLPSSPTDSQIINIYADVTDNLGVDTVMLHYNVNEDPEGTVMLPVTI